MIAVLARRGIVLSLLWWVLGEGRADSWGLGAVGIAAALAASAWLLPPRPGRLSWRGVLGFLGYFLVNMTRAGIQVARIALRPRLDLQPALVELALDLPQPGARLLMAGAMGLMPGTVSVDLNGNLLRVHVLDRRLPMAAETIALRQHIERMFP